MVNFLENRAYDALETSEQCQRRRDRLRRPTKRPLKVSAQVAAALRWPLIASGELATMADDVALLVDWLRHYRWLAHLRPTVANSMTLW